MNSVVLKLKKSYEDEQEIYFIQDLIDAFMLSIVF